jgi:hypothetical protein
MSLPRVRFTVRRLMAAVAVFGLIFWTTLWLGKRTRAYQWMAEYHAAHRWTAPMVGPPWTAPRGVDSRGEVISAERDRWHAALAAKYLRAARYPWLSVEPDPPEPE